MALPACCNCSPYLFAVYSGKCPAHSPVECASCQSLLEAFPSLSTLDMVGWHYTRLLCRLVYLPFAWGVPLPHSTAEHAARQPLLEAFTSPSTLDGVALCLPSPAECATWESAPPPYSRVQDVPPSLLYVIFFSSLFIIFFCRVGVGLSRGYADFSQGWLWENLVPLICSPVDLPSRLGASAWRHRSPPGFSMYCDVGGAMCGWE
jgi:hypothetical protein